MSDTVDPKNEIPDSDLNEVAGGALPGGVKGSGTGNGGGAGGTGVGITDPSGPGGIPPNPNPPSYPPQP